MEVKHIEGLPMEIFKTQISAELENFVAKYPTPRLLVVPDRLAYYFAELIDGEVRARLFANTIQLSNLISTDKATVCFIASSEQEIMNAIADTFDRIPNALKIILSVPKVNPTLETIIATKGMGIVKGFVPADPSAQVGVGNFSADFVPIEKDMFMMPCKNTFRRYAVDHDYDDLHAAALSIMKIQQVFGQISHVVAVGEAAVRVKDVLGTLEAKIDKEEVFPQISTLILLDRRCDLVTPLTSAADVESVIKSAYGLNYGWIDDKDVPVDKSDPNDVAKPIKLWEKMTIYPVIRSMSHTAAFKYHNFLREKIEKQREFLKEIHTTTEITGNKELIKLATQTYGMFKSFGLFYNATRKLQAENPLRDGILNREFELLYDGRSIVDVAENMINVHDDWKTGLRLLGLQSASGYGKVAWDKVRVEMACEFGLSCQESLIDFEKAGFVAPDKFKPAMKAWGGTKELFTDFDEEAGTPLSPEGTAFGGYIPRSVRLVERIVKETTKKIPDRVMRDIPFEEVGSKPPDEEGEKRKVLVFFLGGVTPTEAMTLRNMGRDMFKGAVEFIIGGTDEITCDSFMAQFFPEIYNV